jgi:hypothetical protein
VIYLVGSLKQGDRVREVAAALRADGWDVFDDWLSAGSDADDSLRDHFVARGFTFKQALASPAARNIFEFDRHHLAAASIVVLVMPAGKSGFLELGWALGQGTRGYILFDGDPDRIDIMMQFADGICYSIEELKEALSNG